ncbi:AmmeMemoRadiSam system protein B [uncultured Desulfuromonas sp.]|uniref:AmmeMemoRadiSam system protein B n=1 Tax=uncultured Desulfuromonas sp. TaxID=181013 RepID=UPI002AAA91A5|nr:AmmeMemoRadiSam system protein B [uncultured Desulfuromonas sp.]
MIRHPVVSGQFYTDDPFELRQQVELFLTTDQPVKPAYGVMMPHAGYVYSGAIAGETLAGVEVPDTVLLLGPNHRGVGDPCALYSQGSWKTPLGEVPIAESLAQRLLESVTHLTPEMQAHRGEHSLEVLLPFLQVKNPDLSIIPLMLGPLSFPVLQQLGDGIGAVLKETEGKVLIVASSDMTHYEPSSVARIKDQLALDALLHLDAEALYYQVKSEHISMCGVCAAVLMVLIARALGARHANLIRYGDSGDVNGDHSAVVGYAGVVVD